MTVTRHIDRNLTQFQTETMHNNFNLRKGYHTPYRPT